MAVCTAVGGRPAVVGQTPVGVAKRASGASYSTAPLTWSATNKGASVTPYGLGTAFTASAKESARIDTPLTGRVYWEMVSLVGAVGLVKSTVTMSTFTPYVGSAVDTVGIINGGGVYKDNVSLGYSPDYTFARFAFNAAAGTLWIGDKNGWLGGGNPDAGSTPTVSGLTGTWYIAATADGGVSVPTAFTTLRQFLKTPPSGYKGPAD